MTRLMLTLSALAAVASIGSANVDAQSSPPPQRTPPPTQRCEAADTKAANAPYVFRYGLSGADLQSQFFGSSADPADGSYNDQSYRPVRLTGYVDDGQVKFATKWVRDAGPRWQSRFGMTGAQFHARYLSLGADGYRILDASGYNTAAGIRYADIWVKNDEGLGWAVTRDVPAAQMDALKLQMLGDGLAPTHVEGYVGSNLLPHFIVTWIESRCQWTMDEEMTGAQYQAFFDANKVAMRPIHSDSYVYDTLVRFAGIFWAQPGPGFRASHGQHWYGFQASSNHNACAGFTVDNFYATELPDGWNAFGGIWTFKGAPAVSEASSVGTRVGYHVNCAPGRASAALINVTTGESVFSHADQKGGSASASKVFTAATVLRKADAEGIDLDTTEVDGKTLATLLTEMIVDSNNTSTNTLIDFVGMDAINDWLEELGLVVSRIERYYTGGPSAHGLGDWFDDFQAGYDNFTTARELATFWQLIYENDGLLSADSYNRFLSVTGATVTRANDALAAGYDPGSVIFYNKPGIKSYTGVPGDFAHLPQLGSHSIRSEVGAMEFANGNVVFYAVIVDQAPPGSDTVTPIACVGWEAAKEWGGDDPGDSAGQCVYP